MCVGAAHGWAGLRGAGTYSRRDLESGDHCKHHTMPDSEARPKEPNVQSSGLQHLRLLT